MTANSSKGGAVPLVTVLVRQEADVVAARQRARQLASLVGFGNQDQVRIATAISELSRNALHYGGGGKVEFALALDLVPQALSITVIDKGPGIANLDSALDGHDNSPAGMGMGLIASRRLMDGFEIESTPGKGTVIHAAKLLPADVPRLSRTDVGSLAARLIREQPPTANETQIQNRDLLESLELLRLREMELEKRHAEMQRINAELEETNRGVVALYAELDEKAAALRSADELKGRFLRHVSHEFRTPLNSIFALSQLLLRRTDGELTPEQERQVGYIRQASQDLTDMVNDLLDLAKVESGTTEVHNTKVYLGQLFGALRGVMRPLVVSDAVSLVFEEPPEEFCVRSDETKLAQILRNLISNALKFTERGEVRISHDICGDKMSVHVADTGIGIAPEDQDRIFQEFGQVNNLLQSRVKGTGLGLPLSRKLAQLLGGELTVMSSPGQGSIFTLTLPIEAPRGAPVDDSGTEAAAVLIIDDDASARYLARQRFRGSRHRVIEASGGIEGAERARFERPALILLDLRMPDRSGFDVLDDLKNDPSTLGIPVIIHTSRRLSESDLERLANRHAAVLPKGELWPPATLDYIRKLLGEPDLCAEELGSGPDSGQEPQ
jgi:signal transduction histidine kinase/CheY-like chemotaxis protein